MGPIQVVDSARHVAPSDNPGRPFFFLPLDGWISLCQKRKEKRSRRLSKRRKLHSVGGGDNSIWARVNSKSAEKLPAAAADCNFPLPPWCSRGGAHPPPDDINVRPMMTFHLLPSTTPGRPPRSSFHARLAPHMRHGRKKRRKNPNRFRTVSNEI